jgi:hypothetical protein
VIDSRRELLLHERAIRNGNFISTVKFPKI